MKHKPGCSFETEIRLEEVAGLVPVKVSRIGDVPRAQFTAPIVPYAVEIAMPSADLVAKALSLDISDIGFEAHAVALLEGGPRFFYVPVKTRLALSQCVVCEPYWSEMVEPLGVDLSYVYTRGGDNPTSSFRSRAFAPTGGVLEDPATGSATALLAAQLVKAESLKNGTHKWQLEQGYEMGRPSDLLLEADVNQGNLVSVRVAGQAVKVMQGTLEI
jgi:trans-2,3-dihydro-3-hydroxyanthranilate isomerase